MSVAMFRSMCSILTVAAFAVVVLSGCNSSKFAGTWAGQTMFTKDAAKKKVIGYSETKPSTANTLNLNGDGSYSAKFSEVDWSGKWVEDEHKVTLNPDHYMGLTASEMHTKKSGPSDAASDIFKPYVLQIDADGASLTHKDDHGTTTFRKS